MKQLLLLPLFSIVVIQADDQHNGNNFFSNQFLISGSGHTDTIQLGIQGEGSSSRMSAAVFKAQEYCRAELKDFEFDARYTIISAVVYFSGASFKNVEKGAINSASLKPIKNQMDRCVPGSVVIFDEVKVKGPDNLIRTIQGLSLVLY